MSHDGASLIRLRPITWAMKLLVRSWWNGVIVPAGPIQKKPPGWSAVRYSGTCTMSSHSSGRICPVGGIVVGGQVKIVGLAGRSHLLDEITKSNLVDIFLPLGLVIRARGPAHLHLDHAIAEPRGRNNRGSTCAWPASHPSCR